MSDDWTERDIVRGLREGDRDAWAALCEQYSARVWRYVSKLIGSDAEAVADVFQETTLAAAESGRGISADTRLWAWLSTIAHNQSALHWRKHYRNTLTADSSRALAGSSDDNPLAVLARKETADAVRRVLTAMDVEQATVLAAKYIEDLSVADIVELFGGTTESVRSRLARARRNFREQYERLLQRSSD